MFLLRCLHQFTPDRHNRTGNACSTPRFKAIIIHPCSCEHGAEYFGSLPVRCRNHCNPVLLFSQTVEKTTCEWDHDVFLETALLGQLTSLGCNPNFRDESRTSSVQPCLLICHKS